jgi:integrase
MCSAKGHVRFAPNSGHKSRHRFMGAWSSTQQKRRLTMHEQAILTLPTLASVPWNKGKLIGAKPPLRQKHVWAIRGMLQNVRNKRDLAMFNLAIDSKLRGCDVVAIKVEDVAPNGYAVDRATVRQRKTGRPVRFELTEHTRQAIDAYLKSSRKKFGEFLFTGPRSGRSMTPRTPHMSAFGGKADIFVFYRRLRTPMHVGPVEGRRQLRRSPFANAMSG